MHWGDRGAAWSWRRRLWAWEEELVAECRHLITDIVLQSDISDRWQWNSDIQGGYTVNGVYHILTMLNDPPTVGINDLVWHKQVPMKVSIFAWRLLRDRLPTKTHLVRRGLIDVEAAGCVAGCGHDESASHLFLHCASFGSLWWHIRSWIGIAGVEPNDICEHFFQFIHCTGHSRMRRLPSTCLVTLCLGGLDWT